MPRINTDLLRINSLIRKKIRVYPWLILRIWWCRALWCDPELDE